MREKGLTDESREQHREESLRHHRNPDPPELAVGMDKSIVVWRAGHSMSRNFSALIVSSVLFVPILLGISGCPGMGPRDNARFRTVVAKNVTVGMPFVTAIEHLVRAGFSCDDRVAAPAVSCTRDRQSLLPYACMQQVNLITDVERKTVLEVTPLPIGCAGL